MFGTVLILITTVMHFYVFWRACSVPFIRRHVSWKIIAGAGILLWAAFYFGRVVGYSGSGRLYALLEFLGMNWMAALFLMFVFLLAADLITLFGLLFRKHAPSLRGLSLLVGLLLAVIALFQGLRPPVVHNYEVRLPGLPGSLDGIVLVALSDMHLGSQLGEKWLAARIDQVQAVHPDLVVLLGDIFEGHGTPAAPLLAEFMRLSAPLGVWAVPGNHEFHGTGNLEIFAQAKIRLLLNKSVEAAPGLVLSGVEDLTTLYRGSGQPVDAVSRALSGRPAGATILLSHTPWQTDTAAAAGVGLMLSAHTHGGQIWPFDYLVKRHYPLLEGRYETGGMTAIVSRGTGTWGPRMRLFAPGEILHITLRSESDG